MTWAKLPEGATQPEVLTLTNWLTILKSIPGQYAAPVATEVAARCAKVLGLPFHWQSCLTGQSMTLVLHEATGISKSRIAEGGFDRLRPSTIAKARAFNLEVAQQAALDWGWPSSIWQQIHGDTWVLPDGTPAHLARLFAVMGEVDRISLSRTAHTALNWESFAAELQRASQRGELERGVDLCLKFRAQLASNELNADADLLPTLAELHQVGDWETMVQITDRLLKFAYYDFFAALDAEWGSQFFKTTRPAPLFLWIAPAIEWDAEGNLLQRSNGIRRPVRRLLELTYAIAYRYYCGSWPSRPPGRSDIAKVLEISDHHAGNYFDGTRRMQLNAFKSWWVHLRKSMRMHTEASDRLDLGSPDMLARVALLWQQDFVHTKSDVVGSVILLDHELYLRRWMYHRHGLPADHANGHVDWPDWLDGQGR